MAITATLVENLTDSIGQQYYLLQQQIGSTSTAGSIAYGANQNVTRIMQSNDVDTITGLLAKFNQANKDTTAASFMGQNVIDAIKGLQQITQGLDNFLSTNSAQVCNYFGDLARSLGIPLSAKNVFPPSNELGSFTATGAGAGTFTAGTPVDTTKYSAGQIVLSNTAVTGAASGTYAVTYTDNTGKSVTVDVTIPASTAAHTGYVVGTGTAVTNITLTGGSANDAVSCSMSQPRPINL